MTKKIEPLLPFHRQDYLQLRGLIDLILFLPNDLIWAEIGCYDGASAELWMLKCKKLYCIDNWFWAPDFHEYACAEVENRFNSRMERFGDRVIKIKGDSSSVASQIPDNSLDGVYIDGAHFADGAKKDIEAYLPKLKIPAYITGHDYGNPLTPDVTKCVDEALGGPDFLFIDSSWLYAYTGRGQLPHG